MTRPEPAGAPPGLTEADLGDYSFDRAVICDQPRTVDFLLANNFHIENRCAVLAVDGYPPGAFETVRAMLKRNPQLQVFALHDATVPGCGLARRLATEPDWFNGQLHVVDVGLRPAQATRFKGLFLPGDTRALSAEGLNLREQQWLSRHRLELAALRPEQVIRRLCRAISKETESAADMDVSAEVVYVDSASLAVEATMGDGGDDTFG